MSNKNTQSIIKEVLSEFFNLDESSEYAQPVFLDSSDLDLLSELLTQRLERKK